jgi:hypothetical protein
MDLLKLLQVVCRTFLDGIKNILKKNRIFILDIKAFVIVVNKLLQFKNSSVEIRGKKIKEGTYLIYKLKTHLVLMLELVRLEINRC